MSTENPARIRSPLDDVDGEPAGEGGFEPSELVVPDGTEESAEPPNSR